MMEAVNEYQVEYLFVGLEEFIRCCDNAPIVVGYRWLRVYCYLMIALDSVEVGSVTVPDFKILGVSILPDQVADDFLFCHYTYFNEVLFVFFPVSLHIRVLYFIPIAFAACLAVSYISPVDVSITGFLK